MDSTLIILTLASMLADSVPLVFAVIGETISEKAGVTNLSLDGSILLSAMVGFAVAFITDNLFLAFFAAMLVGALVAAIVAFSSIVLKLDQIAVGFVLTLLCSDLSTFFGNPFVRKPGPSVPHLAIPGLENIPVIGKIFFDQNVVVYLSFILIIAAWWYIFKTQPGLKLQGIGERPAAAFARGTNVNLQRFIYTLIGGALVGFGGASYSLFVKLGWAYHLTSGIGWIALSIVIFGGWNPIRAAIGAYIFGGLQSISGMSQSIPAFANVPTQVFQTAPFALMIVALLIVSNESIDRFFSGSPMSRKIWQSLRALRPARLVPCSCKSDAALKSRSILLVTAIIWGFAFVAQRKGMESVQPFTFNAVRFLIGCISLMPVALINQRRDIHSPKPSGKLIWLGGGLTGLALFTAASLQQIGMVETSAGKAGFITGLYIILVPIMGLALGRRTGLWTWAGAVVGVVGLYLLTVTETLTIEHGDLLVLASAFFLAVHVHLIDKLSERVGAIRLSLIQFAVVVVASFIAALSFESIRIDGLIDGLVPILYTGVLSVGVAYTLQVVGQQGTPPSQAAIILSLETVFAGLGGWLILSETLPARGLIGCGLMFAGMTLSQLDGKLFTARRSRSQSK